MSRRRYFRLDDYRAHWKKCHKDQEWVNPQTRERFTYLWQEYCEQRSNRPFLITPSPLLQQAPGLVFPQLYSTNVAPSSAIIPPAADSPVLPMRLAQAPAQVALIENSLGLFGQDLFALTTPLSDANVTGLVHPPNAYNYPATSISFPSAFDYTHYSGYTPIDTTLSSLSSSVSTSTMPIPPAGDVFTSGGANYQFQVCLEPFGAFDPDFRPSQANSQDWSKWLADFDAPLFRASD